MAATPFSERGHLSAAQVQRVRDFVEARLHEPIEIGALAAVAGLGIWTFARQFRRDLGISPHAYVIARRLDRARGLLRAGACPTEVADACGFADQSHLTRHFRARLGTTPAAFARGGAAGLNLSLPSVLRDGNTHRRAEPFRG